MTNEDIDELNMLVEDAAFKIKICIRQMELIGYSHEQIYKQLVICGVQYYTYDIGGKTFCLIPEYETLYDVKPYELPKGQEFTLVKPCKSQNKTARIVFFDKQFVKISIVEGYSYS